MREELRSALPDGDHASVELGKARVVAVVQEAVERVAAVIVEHYSGGPAADTAQQITSRLMTAYRRGHNFEPKRGRTLAELASVVPIFYALEVMRALVLAVPQLAARRDQVLDRCRSAPSVTAAWRAIGLDRVPALMSRPVDPVRYLAPAMDYFGGGPDAGEEKSVTGFFDLWRDEIQHGFELALYGRDSAALARFSPLVQQLAQEPLVDVEALEDAHFEHYEREVTRALHPFGLAGEDNRDAFALALSLTHESESAGTFARSVAPSTDGGPVADHALRTAFMSGVKSLQVNFASEARPVGSFDLVRIAASVQVHFEEKHQLLSAPLPSGWNPRLAQLAFQAGERVDTHDRGERAARYRAFLAEVMRLLPYDTDIGWLLDGLWPAGSVPKITQVSENSDIPSNLGLVRTDAIVFAVRGEILRQFYRERLKNEQLGARRSWTLREVNVALTGMLGAKIAKVYLEANQRPHEVQAWVRTDEDVEELVELPASRPRNAAILSVATPASSDWVHDFVAVFPTHRRIWQKHLEATSSINPAVAARLVWLEAFTVWVAAEADAHEASIIDAAAESRAINDLLEHRRPVLDERPGRRLPHDARNAGLAHSLAPTIRAGIARWSRTLPERQAEAAAAVWRELQSIYTSPLWGDLAAGGSRSAAPPAALPTAEMALFARDPLLELVPAFLQHLVEDNEEGWASLAQD